MACFFLLLGCTDLDAPSTSGGRTLAETVRCSPPVRFGFRSDLRYSNVGTKLHFLFTGSHDICISQCRCLSPGVLYAGDPLFHRELDDCGALAPVDQILWQPEKGHERNSG